MTLKEQVYAQAALLAGELDETQAALLDALCGASTVSLAARLRTGLSPEDCKADFIAAASLFALSAMNEVERGGVEQVVAGDLTLRRSGTDAASRCLHTQAWLMIAPYLKDRFSFVGV